MGGGSWDSRSYASAASTRRSAGVLDFDYDDKVKRGAASGVHASLNPKTVAGHASPLAGKVVRESRDSPEHPHSLPIACIFDVTGSMRQIPQVLQKKLPRLMDVVIEKAGVVHPQILVGAVGDSTCDRYPFQVGQFESDNRFDEQLRAIILEGGGGGQVCESYALAYRFAAYHTATDSFEKRGKKGYFFTMGDEMPWPTVPKGDVERIFGVKAEKDETVEELLAKAQETWEIFHLFSQDGSYRDDPRIIGRWQELLGERLIKVEDSSLICEVIAGVVHMLESSYDAASVVSGMGLTGAAARTVQNALVPVRVNRVVRTTGSGSAPRGKAAGGIERV